MASIKFENIEYKDATTGLGLDNKVGVVTNGADYNQFRGEKVDTIFPSVNAIEIDWNGANYQVPSTNVLTTTTSYQAIGTNWPTTQGTPKEVSLTTTSDFLKMIKEIKDINDNVITTMNQNHSQWQTVISSPKIQTIIKANNLNINPYYPNGGF